jgi:hypothetical protein
MPAEEGLDHPLDVGAADEGRATQDAVACDFAVLLDDGLVEVGVALDPEPE